jgi:hypothetical protein
MKTNLFLSCVAVILLFLAYGDGDTPPAPAGALADGTTSSPLFLLSAEAVTKISISTPRRCVVARKNPETSELFREISAMLLQGRVVRRFSPPGTDFSAYGLAPAPWQISLAGADETRQFVLLLGHLNPVGNAVYARRLDGGEVLLVGSYLLTALDVVFERLRSSRAGIVTEAPCEEEKTVVQ